MDLVVMSEKSVKFEKLKHNPIELIKTWWPNADISHIEYDESILAKNKTTNKTIDTNFTSSYTLLKLFSICY